MNHGKYQRNLECNLYLRQYASQAGSYINCRCVHCCTTTHTSTQSHHVYLISAVFSLFCLLFKCRKNPRSHFVSQTLSPRMALTFDPSRRCPAHHVVLPNVTPFDISSVYNETSCSVQEKVGCRIYRLTFTSPCVD